MSFMGSLIRKPSAKRSGVVGHIDGYEDRTLMGWAVDREASNDSVEVALFLNEVCLGEGIADMPRQDLCDAGYGDGRHGFAIKVGSVPPQPEGAFHILVYKRGRRDRAALGRIDVTAPVQAAMKVQMILGGVIAAPLASFEAMLSDVRKGVSVPEAAMTASSVQHCLRNGNFAASILRATPSVMPR